MPSDQQPEETTYFIDAENVAEMARLAHQDRLLTKEMGGLFPPQLDLSTIHNVLDIGCGPGGWVLDVAQAHPIISVTGIDISHIMAHVLDCSVGMEAHTSQYQNTMTFLKLIQPFLLKMNMAKKEELDALYKQVPIEMNSDEYCSLWYYLSVWSEKPI